MKNLYTSTFDQLSLPEAKKNEIRHSLSQFNSDRNANTRGHRNAAMITAVAAAFALVLLAIPSTRAGIVTAAEYIRNIFLLADGTEAVITSEVDSTSASFDEDALAADKYYQVIDDKVYFVLDDVRIDITDKCSSSSYYRYDKTNENGYTSIIFVGGDIDNLGWAEFVFDDNGTYITNLMSVPEDNHWLDDAMTSISVPTGNPALDFPNE